MGFNWAFWRQIPGNIQANVNQQMWHRSDWNEDRHLTLGIQEIRFNNILSKEVMILQNCRMNKYRTLRGEEKTPASHYEVPADSEIRYNDGSRFYKLYQQYRLSLFLYEQFSRLKDAINQTCTYFYQSNEVPVEMQQPFLKTVNEAMMAYYEYENEKFFLGLDGGGYNVLTRPFQLEQDWLVAQIFGSQQSMHSSDKAPLTPAQVAEKIKYIRLLECLKIGHILWDFVEEQHMTLRLDEKLIAKLPEVSDTDGTDTQVSTFKSLCFYLALAYTGIIQLNFDKYASVINSNQAWRLSPDLEFAVEFCHLLSVKHLQTKLFQEDTACLVLGHVLPYRDFEAKHETQSVNAISKRQYILLTDLIQVTKPKDECCRKEDAVAKINSMKFMCKWVDVCEHLRLNNLREYKLGILDVFKKENCQRSSLPQFLRENVGCCRIDAGKESTIKIDKTVFDDIDLLECDKKDFIFDAERRIWIVNPQLEIKDTITQIFKNTNMNDQQWKADEQIVKKLSSEQNVEKLLSIIDQIPNLDIKLSTLQQAVVSSSENLLCLGRSGTGKTTSSVLRLFAQELMYMSLKKAQKISRNRAIERKMDQAYQGQEVSDQPVEKKPISIRLESKDFLKPSYMKTVFISASPVLVNEVNRFYTQLRESIINHLKSKEQEALRAQKSGTKEEQDLPEEQQIRLQQEELMKLIKIEADQIEQELATEQQTGDLPAAFEDLKPQHFPLFLTLKQLLFMLDASLYDSFFFRDSENKVVGMENNLTWHNENKGLFMINQQYKTDADYNKLMLEFTNEVLNDVDAEDIIKETQVQEAAPVQEQLRSGGWRYKRQGNGNGLVKRYWDFQRQQLSFEIDYDVFVTRFFNRFKQKSRTLQRQKKLSEALIWTEIFSVIKGGSESTRYYGGILPARKYIMECGSPTLTKHELQTVYWIFIEYEKWKEEQNAFDLMDLVIHLRKSNKVSSQWYSELRMDYLMIDEVQDLTPATLELLIRLTKNKVFFAGDTAQTIAKGVGARFSDLQQIFKQLDINVIQLTTNYRSHGKILSLANSVVSIIETLFPYSIDKLKKEESESDGLRPVLLTALKPHELKRFFLGAARDAEGAHPQGFSGNRPQFGCSQVIIVRDQEMKDQVPEFLANMLCLTVYEAKGLEFDDVFLFNFFSGDNIEASHWKLLNEIGIEEAISENAGQEEIFTKIDQFCANAAEEENKVAYSHIRKESDKANVIKMQRMINESTKNRSLIYRKYSLLCVELKYLYVAITRPRKRLIIYDEKVKIRQPIQRVWEALGIVDVVNSHMIENGRLPPEIVQIFQNGYVSETMSSTAEWKLQGIKFFKKKCFDQAIKCFKFADEPGLVTRCVAYQLADSATAKVAEIESNNWRIKNSNTLSKSEKRVIQKLNQKIRVNAKTDFKLAGESFEECSLYVQAASCYFSAKAFERAGMVFEKLKQFSQAGECLMRLKTPDAMLKAADMFEKGKLITRAIECYEQLGAWEQLLHCLHKHSSLFREDERQRLANRYIPIALNKLYLLLTNESAEVSALEKNKGALQELRIKRKFENQEKIDEEDEDEAFSSSEEEISSSEGEPEEGEVTIDVNLTNQVSQSEPQQITTERENQQVERLSDISYDLVDEENEEEKLDVFDEMFQLDKKKSSAMEKKANQVKAEPTTEADGEPTQNPTTNPAGEPEESKEAADASFEVIDEQQSASSGRLSVKAPEAQSEFEELAMSNADFDHLSQYDPDDEFLQSAHSISILEGILSSKLDQSSDYSVIEGDDGDDVSILSLNSSVKGSEHMRFIARHQKVEDKIVQKIIYYISLFSSEVRDKLDSMHIWKRSKQAVDLKFREDEEIKLDKVPIEFIEVVLSILEHYDLIRLGLIICNKFKLNHHIGKYVVQSCLKYSNLHLHRYCHFQLRSSQFSQGLVFKQRQASIIAHEAMHNVLGLISPKYLTLKKFNEPLTPSNSLGLNNYKLMLQLGFWKKLVYAVNGRTSLALCFKFNDLDNYNFIAQKMIEANESETTNKITNEQFSQIAVCRLVLTYKCAIAAIHRETKVLDQQNVFEDSEAHEKRFAILEMQLQDLFFDTSEDTLPLVSDLVMIARYMLPVREKQLHSQLGNQVHAKAAIDQQLQANKDKSQAYSIQTRAQVEQLLIDKLLPEPVNDEEFTRQCCLGFYLLSFNSLPKQIELISQSTEICQKVVSKLQLLLSYLDFRNIMSSQRRLKRDRLARKVFFACYNLHALDRDDFEGEEAEDFFEEFEGQYYLMNVNSHLADKLQDVQQKLLATTLGQQVTKLFRTNAKRYFYQCTLKQKVDKKLRLLELDPYATEGMVKIDQHRQLAAMIDLDLQFVMVPARWANVIIQKRASRMLDIIHTQSTKNIAALMVRDKTTLKDTLRLKAFRFNNQMDRKNLSQHRDFDQHFSMVLTRLMQGYARTTPCIDEKELFASDTRYKKLQNMQMITQPQINQAAKQPIHQISGRDMHICNMFESIFDGNFTTGLLQAEKFTQLRTSIQHDSMLLQMAMHLLTVKNWSKLGSEEEIFERYLKILADAHSALSIIDLDHVYVDSLRSQLRLLRAQKKSLAVPQQMQKLAMDAALKVSQVNVCILGGAISMASTKLLVFYRQVQPLMNSQYAAQILEKAFYPVLIGMMGKAYVPQPIVRLLDPTLDLMPLIIKAHDKDPECGDYFSDDEHDPDDREEIRHYTEWDIQEVTEIKAARQQKLEEQQIEKYKPIVEVKVKSLELESVKQDQEPLAEILRLAVELLRYMNKDVFDTRAAKMIFNMLMVSAVNLKIGQFGLKKQVNAGLIKKGFQELQDCHMSEYFEKISFQYFDSEDEAQIIGLRKMFTETEDSLKYQFFAFQKYLLHIDVSECQQKSKSKNNQNILETTVKSGNKSLRLLVKREMAKQTLRRCIRRIKARKQLRDQTMKTVQTLRDYGITVDLQGIDQTVFAVSGIEKDLQNAVRFLKMTQDALGNLSQLVLSKSVYLSSSFDIQMFYATQKQLSQMRIELLTQAQAIIDNKLYPLRGYFNLEAVNGEEEGDRAFVTKYEAAFESIKTRLAIWQLRSKAARSKKETEQLEERTKRLNIKWNSWNQLTQKKARLQNKLKQLQQ